VLCCHKALASRPFGSGLDDVAIEQAGEDGRVREFTEGGRTLDVLS